MFQQKQAGRTVDSFLQNIFKLPASDPDQRKNPLGRLCIRNCPTHVFTDEFPLITCKAICISFFKVLRHIAFHNLFPWNFKKHARAFHQKTTLFSSLPRTFFQLYGIFNSCICRAANHILPPFRPDYSLSCRALFREESPSCLTERSVRRNLSRSPVFPQSGTGVLPFVPGAP